MKTEKKNFTKKLNLVCGTDDLRPVMQYIVFQDGCSVCTNAHVLVKRSLELDSFLPAEIEQMEGRAIHKSVYVELLRYDTVSVVDGKFHCIKDQATAVFDFSELPSLYPNWKAVIPNDSLVECDEIGIAAKNLKLVHSIASDDQTRFKFFGKNKAILIKGSQTTWEEETILIMPILLS